MATSKKPARKVPPFGYTALLDMGDSFTLKCAGSCEDPKGFYALLMSDSSAGRTDRMVYGSTPREAVAKLEQLHGKTLQPWNYIDKGLIEHDSFHESFWSYRRSNPTEHTHPTGTGGVLLAVGAAVGFFWWLFRTKAETPPTTKSLPAPPTPTAPTPPAPIQQVPKLPQLNCSGKVVLTYKLKDTPNPVIKVFRRLTSWSVETTPDHGVAYTETIWAKPSAASFFNIGAQIEEGGWLEETPLEKQLKNLQAHSVTQRYLAEAWLETSDGWCLAATDTNYEPWVKA